MSFIRYQRKDIYCVFIYMQEKVGKKQNLFSKASPEKSKKGQDKAQFYNHQQYQSLPKKRVKLDKQLDQPKMKERDYEVKIVVNPEKVDLKYEYHNPIITRKWNLKEELQKHITMSLRAGLAFKKKEAEFRILDEKVMKSGQTGNFQFDPFCFSVKISLCNVIGEKFDSYKLDQNKTIGFTYSNDLPQQVGKDQITDDTSIDQLMENIGKVLQIQKDRLDNYKHNFKINFVKKVSDLKSWKEEEISKTNSLPLKVAKEVYKAVNKIDYYSEKMFTSKKFKNNIQSMKCAKLGNSHKVLRYCLFKNNSQQLERVSYLNFQNIKQSLDIINKQLKLEESINQNLKGFLYQFALPHGPKYVYSRGAIFNGPPGTGKTMITELLMFLCGFSLISQGISASDFSKSYVGQAGRMIYQLFSRAHCCSYLACSIAIDEIEGAFPNRNDASEKNKGEATSQFLSVIEGNKNIENLFILSSTNHINKIDEAALRRLGDRSDLTRLNFSDREILLKEVFGTEDSPVRTYLHDNQKQKEMILNLTMNFTGAAFKKLLSQLEGAIQNKIFLENVNENAIKLKDEEVENMITKIANDYKIIFGPKTLPELVHSNEHQKKYLNKQFLQSIESHFMFITIEQQQRSPEITLAYMNKRRDKNGELIRELEKLKFNTYLELIEKDRKSMNSFTNFLEREMTRNFDSQVQTFESAQQLNKAFKQVIADSKERPKIFLITDQLYRLQNQTKDMIGLLEQIECFKQDKENVFVFYVSINFDPGALFGMTKSKKNYSGRIMAEIDKAPRIVFELKPTFPKENLIYIQNHFSGDEEPKPDDLIPDIMQFFNENKLSNIFMIDNYFLEAKNAFTSEKEIETIRAVIEEAQKLSNVGLIINFDSLLISSKTGGNSKDDKDKEEFEIDNKTLYRSLINICRTFSCNNDRVQRWVALFVKSSILIKKIRSDIYWPEMPDEAIQKKKEEELNRKRVCCRCGQQYTEKQNQEQRKCSQHPGILINTLKKETSTIDFETALRQNQMQELKKNTEENSLREFPNYIYSCCFANVKETESVCAKRHLFRHIEKHEKGQLSDELHLYQNINFEKWNENLERIKKQLLVGGQIKLENDIDKKQPTQLISHPQTKD